METPLFYGNKVACRNVAQLEKVFTRIYFSRITTPHTLSLENFPLSPDDTRRLKKLNKALKKKTTTKTFKNVRFYGLSLSSVIISPVILDFIANIIENMPGRHFLEFSSTDLEASEREQVEKSFLKLGKVREIRIRKSDTILGPVLEYATRTLCSFLEFESCNFTQHTKLFKRLLYKPNLVELSLIGSLLRDISSWLLMKSTRFLKSLKKLVLLDKSIPEGRLVALFRGFQEVTEITSLRLCIVLNFKVCNKLLSDLVTRNPDFLLSLRLLSTLRNPRFDNFLAKVLARSNLVEACFPSQNFCPNDSYSTLRLSLEEFSRVREGRRLELSPYCLTATQVVELTTLAAERGFSFLCQN